MLRKSHLSWVLVALFFISSCSSDDSGSAVDPDLEPDPPVLLDVTDCLFVEAIPDLEVVTWNLEQFPKNRSTVAAVDDILRQLEVDIIALQEIRNRENFELLVDSLQGWEGRAVFSSDLNLGFLYRSEAVSVIEEADEILANDNFAFPRPPVKTKIIHSNGLEVTFINVHLKCCDGSEDRRRSASVKIKTYIDENLSEENVIVLGDYNDLIIEPNPDNNVFQNLIDDSLNYRFADMSLAADVQMASYPSWPSHLDHLLVTNELFDNLKSVETLKFDDCDGRYDDVISDHRPVLLQLQADE